MPTKQETFDTVARHLLDQGEKAIDENGKCRYRTPGGLKCAAGCLIPQIIYKPSMEGTGVIWHGPEIDPTPAGKAIQGIGHDIYLVYDLQRVHDEETPSTWSKCLAYVAQRFGLSTEVLDSGT